MRYPQGKSRVNSCRSCASNSIGNTLVTTLSETRDSCVEDERSGCKDEQQVEGLKLLAERDMRSLHKHIPALGRRDVQLSGIRQHFYPEGGWGWVVVFCSFLAQALTSGLLLSGGVLSLEIASHFPPPGGGRWEEYRTSVVTAAAWSISLGVSPIVTHLCRQTSVRLVAVVGGLVMNLAFLFASFGQQLHQVLLSYGLLFPLGCCAVRDASSLMVGQYFKVKRELVELLVLAGPGLGIVLFSLLYKQSVSALRWRLGLQSLQAVTMVAFFLGLFLRSASLYHPQRDAISHIKYQKEKVKPINPKDKLKQKGEQSDLFDLSFVRNRNMRIYLASSGTGALGMYTPLFHLAGHLHQEHSSGPVPGGRDEEGAMLLLQLWLGLSTCCGCIIAGIVTTANSRNLFISKRFLLQLSYYGAAVAMFSLYCVQGFHGYVMVAWIYGLFFGSYLYISKIFCYSIVRSKEFSRTWSIVQAVQAVPCLLGVSLTGYINTVSGDRTGYWLSLLALALAGATLSLLPLQEEVVHRGNQSLRLAGSECGACRPSSQARFNLDDFDDGNNVSMTAHSKVDQFLAPSLLPHHYQGNLRNLGPLSHSEPEVGSPGVWRSQEHLPEPQGILKRQATWHKLLDPQVADPVTSKQDMLVIDQITSTV